MKAKEFLTISEEDIIYEIPEDDDQIIAEIASHYKKNEKIIDGLNDLNDDITEILAINPNTALKFLIHFPLLVSTCLSPFSLYIIVNDDHFNEF